MLRCMYSGISGMKVNQTKLDVIGNNIANVGTTAFKSSSARFKDMLYQNAGEATSPTSTKGGTNAKQVGLGAQLSSINKMMGQGNALSTGRSLDACVDGDGYFVTGSGIVNYGATGIDGGNPLTDTHGLASGGDMDILYTRDGNLTLDYEGNLLTSDGRRIMGYLMTDGLDTKNKAVSITTDKIATVGGKAATVDATHANFVDADSKQLKPASTDKLEPLMIPDQVWVGAHDITNSDGTTTAVVAGYQPVKKFEIGKQGLVTAILGDGSRTALGQIAMATFKNPEGLNSVGGNLLQKSSNSGTEIIRTAVNGNLKADGTIDPAIEDNSKGFGDFIQGALEGSNVDLTEQFTDMITATRSFQAASKMITTGDEILQTITGLMR